MKTSRDRSRSRAQTVRVDVDALQAAWYSPDRHNLIGCVPAFSNLEEDRPNCKQGDRCEHNAAQERHEYARTSFGCRASVGVSTIRPSRRVAMISSVLQRKSRATHLFLAAGLPRRRSHRHIPLSIEIADAAALFIGTTCTSASQSCLPGTHSRGDEARRNCPTLRSVRISTTRGQLLQLHHASSDEGRRLEGFVEPPKHARRRAQVPSAAR